MARGVARSASTCRRKATSASTVDGETLQYPGQAAAAAVRCQHQRGNNEIAGGVGKVITEQPAARSAADWRLRSRPGEPGDIGGDRPGRGLRCRSVMACSSPAPAVNTLARRRVHSANAAKRSNLPRGFTAATEQPRQQQHTDQRPAGEHRPAGDRQHEQRQTDNGHDLPP